MQEFKIKPIGNNILVKPLADTTSILANIANQTSLQAVGEVVAVGDDVTLVKAGDTIAYKIFAVDEVEYSGIKHYFVYASDEFIPGVVETK